MSSFIERVKYIYDISNVVKIIELEAQEVRSMAKALIAIDEFLISAEKYFTEHLNEDFKLNCHRLTLCQDVRKEIELPTI